MVRFDLILGFIGLALLIFCLVDVISIYETRIKSLNKIAWVFIVILLPVLGPILWLTLGKYRAGAAASSRSAGGSRRPLAPDDDPVFLKNATRHEEQEARIRRLEAELKALGDDKPEE
ncbi:MAG: PLD nuclease N-terminal domain-containing protein [Galbitalea sp.]